MRVGVIGAGLSGLAAAWLLARDHEVTLFERHAAPGFTVHGVDVPGPQGSVRVDMPLRVFYPGYYPTLTALYRELGVASEPVSYAATFCNGDGRPYFRYRNLRIGDRSWGIWAPRDALLGQRAWQIGLGLLRCHRRARASTASPGLTIGEWAARERLPEAFVEGFLLPAICTVCTCGTAQARAYPAEVVIDYMLRGLTRESVRRAIDGADGVLHQLLAGIPPPRCNVRIHALSRDVDGVLVHHDDGAVERFDQLVIAAQANQALTLIADASADERAVLGAFRYTPVEVVTHRDARLMPARRRDWSPVNLHLDPRADGPESTIWVNAVQPALREAPDVFQTVQPLRRPEAATLLGQARFERPLVDANTAAALQGLQRLHRQPQRRLWFCGSYAAPGVPLLESAVASARSVVDAITPLSGTRALSSA